MGFAIALAVVAVLATVLAAWDRLASGKTTVMLVGVAAVVTALLAQAGQLWEKQAKLDELERAQQRARDMDVLVYSELFRIDEASGGAVDPTGAAYVVDDEESELFRFPYDEKDHAYRWRDVQRIELNDPRPCEQRSFAWDDKDASCTTPTELKNAHVTDLEGAAFHNGHLYLISTLGNPAKEQDEDRPEREPKREAVLEVTLEGEIVNASRQLRPAIERLFLEGLPCSRSKVKPWSEGTNDLVMRVEGLAIDADGWVYIGLRAPLVDAEYALVLRTRLEELFASEPRFEDFRLALGERDAKYGIVSLDYDAAAKSIVVLGNHPDSRQHRSPRIWTWQPTACADVQRVQPLQGHIFSDFEAPGRPAKPEVVLALRPELLHVFFDARGNGGQMSLARSGERITQLPGPWTKPAD
jgi:hypothetical protein